MSEQLNVGDKAYVEVEISEANNGMYYYVPAGGRGPVGKSTFLRSIPPSPVDVSAIRVGDEVTVRCEVRKVDLKCSTGRTVLLCASGHELWFNPSVVATHTPAQRPTTLAEFESLPLEVRERLFAEMVKAKRVE